MEDTEDEMDKDLRHSGLEMIGDIPWGIHIGQLYTSKADIFEIGVPFIQLGLENNEVCIWIYSPNSTAEEIKSAMGKCIKDIDSRLDAGQLRIIPYTKWYLKEDGSFDEVRINRQRNELINYSLQNGYKGLRAVTDTSWLEKNDYKTYAKYEQNLDQIISELPYIVLCLYDAKKLNLFNIAQIMKDHVYVIARNEETLEVIKNVDQLIKEKQLKEIEEKHNKLLRILPDAVYIYNEKTIFYCNDSAARIIGIKDTDKLQGRSMLEFVPSEVEQSFRDFIRHTITESQDTCYFQTKFLCFNGEIKNVEIVATKYYLYGNLVLLSVVRDISPFQRIRELEKDVEDQKELLNDTLEHDKTKTEFFSNISHELRTPLTIILSTVQLLNEIDNGGENKYLKIIQQNSYRMLRLVNNLIDITKIDADYFVINVQNYDIVGLVKRIVMSVFEYAKKRGITIYFDADAMEKVIACDPDQIERVMLNLLSNAIKFTREGGFIWVSVASRGEKMEITVEDTGIGIPKDKLETIFQRFQQADRSFTRQYEGSGIGLSLVKALVEKHNGKVKVDSELGKGSKFTVELPSISQLEPDGASEIRQKIYNYNFSERMNIEFSDVYT